MGYGPQEPYEPYQPYEYGQYQPNPYEGAGGGEPGYGESYPDHPTGYQQPEYQPFPEQGYEQLYQQADEQGYPEQGYPDQGLADPAGAADAQWAMSGMGWEQRAWDEARLGVSPLQDYGREQGRRQTDYESNAPGRGSRRRAAAPEPEPGYADYDEYGGYGERPGAAEVPHPRTGRDADAESGEPTARQDPAPAAVPAPAPAAATPAAPGRGAFGAAGLGAISTVAALASASAVLVVIALVQLGVAYGWQLAAGFGRNGRGDRRSIVLTALTGWAASAAAFRLTGTQDEIGVPAALGIGFLLLAADQTLRQRPALGEGERITALAVSVGGALFAALPAGFVVADRADTGLTAACASAAAVGVLCCALIGRDPLRGVLAALVPGAAVGALAATSFSAAGGMKAGALGGAAAALAAAAGCAALDRMAAEGELRGSTRIVAQTLPIGLAAVGAVFATALFR